MRQLPMQHYLESRCGRYCISSHQNSTVHINAFFFFFHFSLYLYLRASQVVPVVKNPPAIAGDIEIRFNHWFGKIPWRRPWQSTPIFLPGESHGQRSLVGYSPWDCKELDTTEACTHLYLNELFSQERKI